MIEGAHASKNTPSDPGFSLVGSINPHKMSWALVIPRSTTSHGAHMDHFVTEQLVALSSISSIILFSNVFKAIKLGPKRQDRLICI